MSGEEISTEKQVAEVRAGSSCVAEYAEKDTSDIHNVTETVKIVTTSKPNSSETNQQLQPQNTEINTLDKQSQHVENLPKSKEICSDTSRNESKEVLIVYENHRHLEPDCSQSLTRGLSTSAPQVDGNENTKTAMISLECTEHLDNLNNDSMDSVTCPDKDDDDEVFHPQNTGSSEIFKNDKSDSACMAALDDTTEKINDGENNPEGTPRPKPRKRRRRGSAWSDEQTEFLMEIWARYAAEQKEEEEANPNTNPPVYRIIAKAMQEQGNTKTWEQCKTRIHTLKRAYKLTKDEITTGAPNITYCRHFDKLEIIMHDNETTPPQDLADLLEARRKHREQNVAYVKTVKTPQRRKLVTVPNKFVKRENTQGPATPQQTIGQPMNDQQQAHPTGTNDFWVNQPQDKNPYEQSQISNSNNQQLDANKPGQDYTGSSTYHQSQTLSNMSHYPQTNTNVPSAEVLAPARMPEINNNDVNVKTERQDNSQQGYSMSTMTSQTWPVPKLPQKEELEKMRLNLELRKIEMERNKLEMAERQRREERDHQYRMLQLLMFGLGQQNSAHSHQGVEQVVAQAQNSTNLSRALENGLVPGGPYTANEKGLSFNEI